MGDDEGGGGGKKTRRLPIQRWTDVAVPVEAYVELGDAERLECSSKPEEMEQHRSGDGDEQKGEGDPQETGGSRDGESSGDGDHENEWQERDNRREERRP